MQICMIDREVNLETTTGFTIEETASIILQPLQFIAVVICDLTLPWFVVVMINRSHDSRPRKHHVIHTRLASLLNHL